MELHPARCGFKNLNCVNIKSLFPFVWSIQRVLSGWMGPLKVTWFQPFTVDQPPLSRQLLSQIKFPRMNLGLRGCGPVYNACPKRLKAPWDSFHSRKSCKESLDNLHSSCAVMPFTEGVLALRFAVCLFVCGGFFVWFFPPTKIICLI